MVRFLMCPYDCRDVFTAIVKCLIGFDNATRFVAKIAVAVWLAASFSQCFAARHDKCQ